MSCLLCFSRENYCFSVSEAQVLEKNRTPLHAEPLHARRQGVQEGQVLLGVLQEHVDVLVALEARDGEGQGAQLAQAADGEALVVLRPRPRVIPDEDIGGLGPDTRVRAVRVEAAADPYLLLAYNIFGLRQHIRSSEPIRARSKRTIAALSILIFFTTLAAYQVLCV